MADSRTGARDATRSDGGATRSMAVAICRPLASCEPASVLEQAGSAAKFLPALRVVAHGTALAPKGGHRGDGHRVDERVVLVRTGIEVCAAPCWWRRKTPRPCACGPIWPRFKRRPRAARRRGRQGPERGGAAIQAARRPTRPSTAARAPTCRAAARATMVPPAGWMLRG